MPVNRLVTRGYVLIAAAVLIGCTQKPVFDPPDVIIDRPRETLGSSSAAVSRQTISGSVSSSRPESLLIQVPFSPQAPFAVWDALHEEACEEMTLIMVHHYLTGTPLSFADAEKELQQMVAWESAHGYGVDVSVAELGAIANSIYGYNFRILNDVSAESLRRELAAGNPVIIPAYGRALGNPYFSGEGPFYHTLVVTGYNSDGFITNDPGTKRGEQYWYASDVLISALHDWIGVKEKTPLGPKNALVIEK